MADPILLLRPVQFVDTPVGAPEGSVARLAGGMQWFAAYEVTGPSDRRVVPVADVLSLDDRADARWCRSTRARRW